MDLKKENKTFFEQDLGQVKKQAQKISLNLHTMPKTETGHFQKWLVLALLIFILIILGVLFFL